MSASHYELLKCEGCGKTLGYIYASAKTWPPPMTPRYGLLYRSLPTRIEKIAFCETCFLEKQAEISKSKSEPKHEKDERAESQRKPRQTRMIR